MSSLDLGKVFVGLDPDDIELLYSAQAKILRGNHDHLRRIVVEKAREYSADLKLQAEFDWSTLTLSIKKEGRVRELHFEREILGQEDGLEADEYLFARAFICWLTSLLTLSERRKDPGLKVIDTTSREGFSYFWTLSKEQGDRLQSLISNLEQDSEYKEGIYEKLQAMNDVIGEPVVFAGGKLYSSERVIAQLLDRSIVGDHLPRNMGILSLGFFCLLVDEAERV